MVLLVNICVNCWDKPVTSTVILLLCTFCTTALYHIYIQTHIPKHRYTRVSWSRMEVSNLSKGNIYKHCWVTRHDSLFLLLSLSLSLSFSPDNVKGVGCLRRSAQHGWHVHPTLTLSTLLSLQVWVPSLHHRHTKYLQRSPVQSVRIFITFNQKQHAGENVVSWC